MGDAGVALGDKEVGVIIHVRVGDDMELAAGVLAAPGIVDNGGAVLGGRDHVAHLHGAAGDKIHAAAAVGLAVAYSAAVHIEVGVLGAEDAAAVIAILLIVVAGSRSQQTVYEGAAVVHIEGAAGLQADHAGELVGVQSQRAAGAAQRDAAAVYDKAAIAVGVAQAGVIAADPRGHMVAGGEDGESLAGYGDRAGLRGVAIEGEGIHAVGGGNGVGQSIVPGVFLAAEDIAGDGIEDGVIRHGIGGGAETVGGDIVEGAGAVAPGGPGVDQAAGTHGAGEPDAGAGQGVNGAELGSAADGLEGQGLDVGGPGHAGIEGGVALDRIPVTGADDHVGTVSGGGPAQEGIVIGGGIAGDGDGIVIVLIRKAGGVGIGGQLLPGGVIEHHGIGGGLPLCHQLNGGDAGGHDEGEGPVDRGEGQAGKGCGGPAGKFEAVFIQGGGEADIDGIAGAIGGIVKGKLAAVGPVGVILHRQGIDPDGKEIGAAYHRQSVAVQIGVAGIIPVGVPAGEDLRGVVPGDLKQAHIAGDGELVILGIDPARRQSAGHVGLAAVIIDGIEVDDGVAEAGAAHRDEDGIGPVGGDLLAVDVEIIVAVFDDLVGEIGIRRAVGIIKGDIWAQAAAGLQLAQGYLLPVVEPGAAVQTHLHADKLFHRLGIGRKRNILSI